jgi:cytochrome oxidase assembly protein ShyY1
MPAIIDSAPDCITHTQVDGSDSASVKAAGDDSLDFILQANYEDCAGIMTFGPGTVYGDTGANGAYYALTWIGIAVMVAIFIGWIAYEARRMALYVKHRPPSDYMPVRRED